MTAFQDFVNTELPLRTNIAGLPTANRYTRFTGVGRGVEGRTPAEVLADIGAAALVHATQHEVGGADVVQTAICEVGTTAPAATATGQLWYDTDATGSNVSSTVHLVTKTGNYTLTADNVVVLGNGTLTLTLPTAVGIAGKGYEIKNIGTGLVTVACDGSETIEEAPVAVLSPKTAIRIRSDNTNWWIL